MAVKTGRGFAAIEYPTGMNQNGDPSQAWIKVKPDGRIDVFAGTSDIGNGSKTIQSQIVAETIGVPYEWITYDNSNTDSSPVCTGTFASRATFVAGKAAEKAAESVRQKILEIAGKELEIDPSDLEIIDGEVVAKGAPQKKISVPDVAAAATWTYGELITGTGAQLKPFATIVEPDDGQGRPSAPLGDLVRVVRGRGRGRRRDGRRHGHAAVAVLRRRQVDQPDARRGPDRGRSGAGARARRPRELLPVLPLGRAPRRRSSASYLAPGHGRPAADRHDHHREPLHRRPVRRQGHRRDGEQRAAARDRDGGVRRGRRLGDRAADHARAGAAGAAGEGRRHGRAEARRQDGRVRRRAVGQRRRHAGSRSGPPPDGGARPSARSTVWSPSPSFPAWGSTPIAGDQVFLGRVAYEPGTTVKRHSHEHTEQAMLILEGSVTMTIGDETRELGPGDVCVVNRGVEHELYSERRRHVHRGARARAARPHRRSRARPRARRPERVAARRALTPGEPERQGRARHRRQPRHRRGDGGAAAAGRLAGRDGRARERRRPHASRAPARRSSSGSTASTRSSATPARRSAPASSSSTREEWRPRHRPSISASVFELAQAAARRMVDAGWRLDRAARLDDVLRRRLQHRAPTAASKGGVAQLAKAMSNELAGRGVRVNAVAPGYIDDRDDRLASRTGAGRRSMARIPARPLGARRRRSPT